MIWSIRGLRNKRPDVQKALAGLQEVLPDFGRKLPHLGKQQYHIAARPPRIRDLHNKTSKLSTSVHYDIFPRARPIKLD
ncbi:hypothetical protein ACQRIT_004033 [Beauveria bassiana]